MSKIMEQGSVNQNREHVDPATESLKAPAVYSIHPSCVTAASSELPLCR